MKDVFQFSRKSRSQHASSEDVKPVENVDVIARRELRTSDQEFQNYQYTYDLIHMYNNLNHKYRVEAFESLNIADSDTKNVYEFKIKLLFSVIVVIYRCTPILNQLYSYK